jgi:hypothetical protein
LKGAINSKRSGKKCVKRRKISGEFPSRQQEDDDFDAIRDQRNPSVGYREIKSETSDASTDEKVTRSFLNTKGTGE